MTEWDRVWCRVCHKAPHQTKVVATSPGEFSPRMISISEWDVISAVGSLIVTACEFDYSHVINQIDILGRKL
jgi:hypothetical protein